MNIFYTFLHEDTSDWEKMKVYNTNDLGCRGGSMINLSVFPVYSSVNEPVVASFLGSGMTDPV
jgi:hypothetical protein